jgi:tungstate transport system substrate-binding protein
MKTKTLSIALSVLLLLTCLAGCAQKTDDTTTTAPATTAPANPVLRCSTTTSVNDSGLMEYLEPLFEAETGYDLQITSNGTGAAIALGESGDADVLLVHAKASEEEFIAEGFGLERIPFMYNYFVIAGPAADPAGIVASNSAADAFKKIAENKSEFISRGDDSGTHKAELKIWTAGGNTPNAAADKWYISAGKGMGDCLTMASEREAYVLTDKATFLSMKANLELSIVLDKGDDMKNTYSLIACNPEKNAGLNSEGAQVFIDWMTSQATLLKIAAFGTETYGEALFFVS